MATKKVAAQADKKQPPELHVELPKPEKLEEQARSPYPDDVHYFAYHPRDGADPILLAIDGFDPPDKLWLFDLAQLPILSQTWKWMERANVPKDVQRQAQSLPDDEYFTMFDEWFEVMKAARGPKGAVTSGK